MEENEEISESKFLLNLPDEKNEKCISDSTFIFEGINYNFFEPDEEDQIIFEDIIKGDIKINIEKENKQMNKIEKSFKKAEISFTKHYKDKNKNIYNTLKFKEESLSKKLEKFFLIAYKIISEKNYDEKEENDQNIKETKHLLNLINEILLEYNNENCKISFIYSENNNVFNDTGLTLNFKIIHKISKFSGLVNIKIIFKVELKMFISSGDAQINISKYLINYESYKDFINNKDINGNKNNDKEIIMKPNFKCFLINNILGNYSITYCTCCDCMNCKNRNEPKPFDNLLNYLKKKNNIKDEIYLTELWYGKFNRYRNESNYKCSFCKDFYQKKLNIVKLFCNPDKDPEHSCIFWICRDCYNKKRENNFNELCPNCKKFEINFTHLRRIFRYYNLRNKQ